MGRALLPPHRPGWSPTVLPGRCRGTKPKTRERLRFASGQKRLTMTEVSSIVEVVSKRVPWNKGKIVGAKPPLLISGTGWMAGIGHGQTHHSSGPTSALVLGIESS